MKKIIILYTYKVRSEEELRFLRNKYSNFVWLLKGYETCMMEQGHIYISVWNDNDITWAHTYNPKVDGKIRKVFSFADYYNQAEKL